MIGFIECSIIFTQVFRRKYRIKVSTNIISLFSYKVFNHGEVAPEGTLVEH